MDKKLQEILSNTKKIGIATSGNVFLNSCTASKRKVAIVCGGSGHEEASRQIAKKQLENSGYDVSHVSHDNEDFKSIMKRHYAESLCDDLHDVDVVHQRSIRTPKPFILTNPYSEVEPLWDINNGIKKHRKPQMQSPKGNKRKPKAKKTHRKKK